MRGCHDLAVPLQTRRTQVAHDQSARSRVIPAVQFRFLLTIEVCVDIGRHICFMVFGRRTPQGVRDALRTRPELQSW